MVKYPHGIHPKARSKPRKKRRSKFNAHVLSVNGVHYDSKLEFNFANYLKNKHVNFIYHPDSIRIVDPYMNGSKKHRGNKFTPDFAIIKDGKVIEYLDTKVRFTRTTATQLRMSIFCSQSDIPLYIVTYDKNSGLYQKELF